MVYSRCCVAFFVADACPFAPATWVQRSRMVRFMSARAPQVARGNCLRVATLCACCEQDEARKTGESCRSRSVRPEVEPLQLAMERGAADAERLGCRRYIALGAQQRALQDAALDVAEMLDRIVPAEQVRRRNRAERALRCETQG